MRELSLFSGAGGGLLGTKLLGWEHVGYVEINEYCQKVISQRIEDGLLNRAPIFGDIRAFISEGYAQSYQGMVDVITAGFPCQPFSVAGKQKGDQDERNMWPETLAVIRAVRPRLIELENVPGLFAHEYIQRIFGDLAESGFDARWRVLSAAEVGAPHKRDRVWIIAHTNELGNGEQYKYATERDDVQAAHSAMADSEELGLQRQSISERESNRGWWSVEPELGRMAHGVADRVDRLKAIGNGQVPAVVRAAYKLMQGD